MTPEQTAAAARELCRIRGIDPDAMDAIGYRVSLHPWRAEEAPMANWKGVTDEIERFAQVGQAIASVIDMPRPTKRKAKNV